MAAEEVEELRVWVLAVAVVWDNAMSHGRYTEILKISEGRRYEVMNMYCIKNS